MGLLDSSFIFLSLVLRSLPLILLSILLVLHLLTPILHLLSFYRLIFFPK
jgi:hypothetical protein